MARKARSFYGRCTNAELKSFYRLRTKHDMPERTQRSKKVIRCKRDFIAQLKKVDRRPWKHEVPRFRFTDLPGELQNMVYTNLLPNSEEQQWHTEILRTGKQVSRDALSIVYADQEPIITLSVVSSDDEHDQIVQSEVSIRSSDDNTDDASVMDLGLCQVRQNWPACLKRFKSLKVLVYLFGPRAAASTLQAGASQALTSLIAYLASDDSVKLETLRVIFPFYLFQVNEYIETLRPVTFLKPSVRLVLQHMPDEVTGALTRLRESREEVDHFYAEYRKTSEQLERLSRSQIQTRATLDAIGDQQAKLAAAGAVRGLINAGVEKEIKDATDAAKAFIGTEFGDPTHWSYSPPTEKFGGTKEPESQGLGDS